MKKIGILIVLLINAFMCFSQTNQIIDKDAATIYLGQNGDSGPHGIVFDDDSGSSLLQLLYRTGPNQLIIENTMDESDLFSIDYDTEYGYFKGNVGIGTFSPNAPLTIYQAGEDVEALDIDILSRSSQIRLGNEQAGPHGIVFGDIEGQGLQFFYRTGPNQLIVEKANDSSDGKDLFSIDYDTEYGYFNGRVGIAATQPESMLQIGNSTTVNTSNYITFGKRLSTVEVNLPFMGHDSFVDRNDLGLGTRSTSGRINFYTGNASSAFDKDQIRMTIKSDGKVGIGTSNPDMKLTVKGNIHAEEVKIDLNIPAPDYVFNDDYDLRTLTEVERFIKINSHLPEIPSAKEFKKNGVMLAETNMNLLKKIEELTLYTIQQHKDINVLKKENDQLKAMNKKLIELQLRVEELENKK